MNIPLFKPNLGEEELSLLSEIFKTGWIGLGPKTAGFENDSHELVFTCTVMMHMPFIAGVLAACEIARVSSKYILHVEGYHTDGIVEGFRTPYNLLIIDYEYLHKKLGLHTLKKFFYQDPYYDFSI
jgi:hypothetical protein